MKIFVSAFAAGFAAMVSQLLLAREMIVISLGDETVIGIALLVWMGWVCIGSLLGATCFKRNPASDIMAVVALFALSVSCLTSVYLADMIVSHMGFFRGELKPIEAVFSAASFSMLPAGLVVGFVFPMLASIRRNNTHLSGAGSVYAWDTLGAMAGGIAFSLVLAPMMSRAAMSVVSCVAAAAVTPLWVKGKRRFALASLIVIFAGSSFAWCGAFNRLIVDSGWGGNVERSVETGYGNLTVMQSGKSRTIYSNGRPAIIVPDSVTGEFMSHTPLLAHPRPKRVLFVGCGPVAISEALKHNPERIFWAQSDPTMLGIIKEFSPIGLKRVFSDKRVTTVGGDARLFLSRSTERFDVIVIDAGQPDTLSQNRYFTREAFDLIRAKLAPGGIAALTIPFSENYMGDAQLAMLGSIIKSLGGSTTQRGAPLFSFGQKPLMMFSKSRTDRISVSPQETSERFISRGIDSAHFNADSAAWAFDSNRNEALLAQFSDDPFSFMTSNDKTLHAVKWLTSRRNAVVNRDITPVAVFHHAVFASTYYRDPIMKRFFSTLQNKFRRAETAYALLLIGVSLVYIFKGMTSRRSAAETKTKKTRSNALLFSMAVAGCAGMVLQITLLLLFQIFFGVVYQYIGLMSGLFLGGSAAGSWLVTSRNLKSPNRPFSPALPCMIEAAVGIAAIALCANSRLEPGAAAVLVMLLSASAGFAVGGVFAAASEIIGINSDRSGGKTYAADLLGAGLGAAITGAVMIPLAGVAGTLSAAVLMSFCAAAVSFSHSFNDKTDEAEYL